MISSWCIFFSLCGCASVVPLLYFGLCIQRIFGRLIKITSRVRNSWDAHKYSKNSSSGALFLPNNNNFKFQVCNVRKLQMLLKQINLNNS
jgi:hypothetical protein